MAFTRIAVIVASLAALFCVPAPARAEWSGQRWINRLPFKQFLNQSTYRRPRSAADQQLVLSDLRISRLPFNHKGIEVGATQLGNGTALTYRQITIRHCEISDAWRASGIHSDFIRIFGGGSSRQNNPISVLLDDIYIHDGNALPIIIQDGQFDRIVLRNIRVEGTANSIQLVAINSGSMNEIYIDNCPGQRISICGRPGSIKTVYVRNSPGCVVRDTVTKNGLSGVRIVYVQDQPSPAPAPGEASGGNDIQNPPRRPNRKPLARPVRPASR